MALAFFGVYTVLIGYLMMRSRQFPQVLGVVTVAGGLGWLTFFYPPLGYRLFLYIAPLGLAGALAVTVWLLAGNVRGEEL